MIVNSNSQKSNGVRDGVQRGYADPQAAAYIGMSISFLRQSRMDGDRANRTPGPPFVRIGRTIRYLKDDLDAWLEQNRQYPANNNSAPRSYSVGPQTDSAAPRRGQ